MKPVRAFVPAHLSCFFQPHLRNSSSDSLSLGFGFTVSQGLDLEVNQSKSLAVSWNGRRLSIPVLRRVCESLGVKAEFKLKSKLPLGGGFGLSGAAALGSALAANELFELGYSRKQLGEIAHAAEVEERTGLADVIGQYYGGAVLRTVKRPFVVRQIALKPTKIYYRTWGKIPTKDILESSAARRAVDLAADSALKAVAKLKRRDFRTMLDISYQFSRDSGLLQGRKAEKLVNEIRANGGHATMAMLGDCVISTVPFAGSAILNVSNLKGEVK